MEKIRISAVKYANTYPFIYGMEMSGFEKKIVLETDHPAECAEKLIEGRVDIGLIPVAVLPFLKKYHIISDYCIGANGNVKTVLLLCNCPFEDIRNIYLDYRSRSSVSLVKVLAKYSWKKDFNWIGTSKTFDFRNVGRKDAIVLIGDQCFEYINSYNNRIDLASEWKIFSGLPFVFACWTANRPLDTGFITEFNDALKLGVNNIEAVTARFCDSVNIPAEILKSYLEENIDYDFSSDKKAGLNLFLKLLKNI